MRLEELSQPTPCLPQYLLAIDLAKGGSIDWTTSYINSPTLSLNV